MNSDSIGVGPIYLGRCRHSTFLPRIRKRSSPAVTMNKILTFDARVRCYKDVKGKAVPLQAWSGPEVSKEVNVSRFHDNGTGWW
jgi:hypothetical protein